MQEIYFLVETSAYGKQILFQYPFTQKAFDKLSSKYRIDRKSKAVITMDTDITHNQILQTFILKRRKRNPFIFDIMIENEHYISYPVWIEQKNYLKNKKSEDEIENHQTNDNTHLNLVKEKGLTEADKYIVLEMFNIVFVFQKQDTLRSKKKLIKNLYYNLESLSRLLLFEEYKRHYLGVEILHTIKFLEKFFNKENINDVNTFSLIFRNNSSLYKNFEIIYNGITKNEISKITINNIDFKYYMSMNISNKNNWKAKPYHSLLIINQKRLMEFFQTSFDINPLIFLFLEKMSPFKTIQEVALENNIEIEFILSFVNQLITWNLGINIFKLQNHSLFQITDSFPKNLHKIMNDNFEYKIIIDNFKPSTIFDYLNKFTLSPPGSNIDTIYNEYFSKDFDNEKFAKNIIYLMERQLIIQCSYIIFVKIPFKSKKDIYDDLIYNFYNCIGKENEIDDENINKINCVTNEYYFEDFLDDIKLKNNKDYILLKKIKNFLDKKLYLDEISFFTCLKVDTILKTLKNYPWIFDLAIIPLFKAKN